MRWVILMETIKKRATFLLLALFILVSLCGCTMNPPAGIGEGGSASEPNSIPTDESSPTDNLESLQQEVKATPAPEPTPEPTPEPIPDPLSELTPELTPAPSPTPSQSAPPVITKQPADESVLVGGTACFVAMADGAEEISWYIAGPDGTTGYSAKEISLYLPAVSCSGHDTDTLTVSNVTADMDGWKAVCRFTNSAGKTYSTAAAIHVHLSVDDRIISVMDYLISYAHPRMAAINVGLPYLVARVADTFIEYDISAEDINRVVSQNLKTMPEEKKEKYIKSALTVKNAFPWVCSDSECFEREKELYPDSGFEYTPKFYPWSQRDLTDCFAALVVG